jgi:hypothetical protein
VYVSKSSWEIAQVNIHFPRITNSSSVLWAFVGVNGELSLVDGVVKLVNAKFSKESIDAVVGDSGDCVPEESVKDPDVVEHHEDADSGGITGLRKERKDGVVEDQVSAHNDSSYDESGFAGNRKEVSAEQYSK